MVKTEKIYYIFQIQTVIHILYVIELQLTLYYYMNHVQIYKTTFVN